MAHAVHGIFPRPERAFDAIRRLDSSGIPPAGVSLVFGDEQRAAEVGSHSFALIGAAAGFGIGLLITSLFLGLGGSTMQVSPVGVVIGGGGMSGGLGFIGLVAG